MEQVTRG